MAGSSPAKTALQTDNTSIKAHGWSDGIAHSTTAPHGVPAHPCSPTLALRAESVEVENAEWDVEDKEMKKNVEEEGEEEVEKDEKEEEEEDEEEVEDAEVDEENVQMEKDMEEEDEEELEEDEKEVKHVDVEELNNAHGSGKAPQPSGDRELGTSSLPSMEVIPGSPPLVPSQPSGTEAFLQALVSQLQAELEQQEVASRVLAARLAREKRRHRQREEASARWAQLQAQEAEALRETNTFLVQALEATVAAGDPGALVRAQEEAQGWREAAEERDARLAGVLAEAAALASRLRDCQVALAAAEGRPDALGDAGAPDEVATVKEVLQRALELARRAQEPPLDLQADGEPVTATGMAMVWARLRGSHSGMGVWGTRAEPLSPTALGCSGCHGEGGGPAEPEAAPGTAARGGTAAGAAQQVGRGYPFPPPLTHNGSLLSPRTTGFPLGHPRMPHLNPGEQHLGKGRGREGTVWGGKAGGINLGTAK